MTTETKWQPGPWKRNDRGDLIDSDGDRVLFTGLALLSGYSPNGPMYAANTTLADAAPDLYAALVGLDALYARAWDLVEPSGAVTFSPETVATFERLHAAASAALARARGES